MSTPLPLIVSSGPGGSTSPVPRSMPRAGLALAVQRTLQREAVTAELAHAQSVVAEENAHMEDILSEQHSMISNADLSKILTNAFVGLSTSSILASRKPVVHLPLREPEPGLRFPPPPAAAAAAKGTPTGSSEGLPRGAFDHAAAKAAADKRDADARSRRVLDRGLALHDVQQRLAAPTPGKLGGRVHYGALLEQQAEQLAQMARDRRSYDAVVARFVDRQQSLGMDKMLRAGK